MRDFTFHNPTRISFGKGQDPASRRVRLGERLDVTLDDVASILELALY